MAIEGAKLKLGLPHMWFLRGYTYCRLLSVVCACSPYNVRIPSLLVSDPRTTWQLFTYEVEIMPTAETNFSLFNWIRARGFMPLLPFFLERVM